MMSNYINVPVEATWIGQEMSRDADLAYDILTELAYQQSETEDSRFALNLFKNIFDNEDDLLLEFFANIVEEFKHLKEEN